MRGGRLFPVRDDWYEWRQEPSLAATVLVRIAPTPGGRLVLAGLRIDGAPTAELLRAIPVGRIEATANAQLTYVAEAGGAVAGRRPRDDQPPAPPLVVAGGWETTATAVRRPAAVGAVAGQRIGAGARGRPDRFYRDVADAYLTLTQASARPVAELARTNGVPPTTAHRWIKEARRRGFLPPGRPGKTG